MPLKTTLLRLAPALLLTAAQAQTPLQGTWVGGAKTLENGQPDRIFIELHQTGTHLAGRFHTLGWGTDLTGPIESGHFKLFPAYDPSKPLAEGDIAGPNLTVTLYNNRFTLTPATPADNPAPVAYIPPPALHPVPPNGLARTPPMGWNSWNKFAGGITDDIVRQIADAMATNGMRDAGYVYLNIDDTWEGVRDATGVLQPNHKFPDMKALADYVHSRGLKLGIYSSPGPRTCGGYPGSYGHEQQDARTWAAWGIDYLKYDWCSAETVYKDADLQPIYQRMGDALQATGRPIVFSLCEYGTNHVEAWGATVGGNLWRTTGDINDTWESMSRIGFAQSPLAPAAGPGHWNDPDMLEIGNGHMTGDEYRTHMSLWSLLAAPLIAGNDLRSLSPATRDILLNRDVIAIDQDPQGAQATRLLQHGDQEIWTKSLADGSLAVGLFNRSPTPAPLTLHASDLHRTGDFKARDLWSHTPIASTAGTYTTTIPAHGVTLLRLTP